MDNIHVCTEEGPTTRTVVTKTEQDPRVTAAYQEIKDESSQQDKIPSAKEENQDFSNTCKNCVEGQSPETFGLFVCGSCEGQFDTVCRLHTHIQSHGFGGSYHYDHRSRTAFPKYDGVCSDRQTQTPTVVMKLVHKSCRENTHGRPEEMMLKEADLSESIISQNDRTRRVMTSENDRESLGLTADVIERKSTSLEKVNSESDTALEGQSNSVSSAKADSINVGEQAIVRHQLLKRECKTTGQQGNKMTRENKKPTRFNTTNIARRGENHAKDSVSIIEQPELQSLKRDGNEAGQQTIKTSRLNKKMRQNVETKADSECETHGKDKDKVVNEARASRITRFSDCKRGDMQKYTCFKCKLVFSSEEFLQAHMQKHQGKLVCDCCNEIFQCLDDLQKHVLDGEGNDLKAVEMFVCSYCHLVVTELKGLLAHLCLSAEDLVLNRQIMRIYTGTVIKKKERYEAIRLTEDDIMDNTELRVQCEICHVWFQNDYFLAMHSVVHRYAYKCSKCNLHFMSEVDRDQHNILCINPASPWICLVCGKRFNSPSNLADHRETHRDTKCEMCDKFFKSKFSLKDHLRRRCPNSGRKERKFRCKICEKTFLEKHRMKQHMEVVHSDGRRFICEICGASSLKSSLSLKKHLLIHKKDRPTVDCDICSAKFRHIECFKRHKKRHVDACTEQCTYCGKMFHERWNLKAHMRQHTGEKPYKCDTCGQGFTHNVSRKNHMKKCRKT